MLEHVHKRWPAVLRQQSSLANHPFMPLANLRGAEGALGLTPLSARVEQPAPPASLPNPEKLADLSMEDLLKLRAATYAQPLAPALPVLAEKLLRYAEIRFPNTAPLHPSLRSRRYAALLLGAFFIDYAQSTDDGRYLNITLKLQDYLVRVPWLAPAGAGLSAAAAHALWCRNIVLIETQLRKLGR